MLIPAVDPVWFEPIGDENLFVAAVKKAGTCGEIGPLLAAVVPQTREACEAAMRDIRRPITPLLIKDRPSQYPAAEFRFYLSALQGLNTPWLAGLRPNFSTFFDDETFKFTFSKAVQDNHPAAVNIVWPGWEMVLFHQSMIPKLENVISLMEQAPDPMMTFHTAFALLGSPFKLLSGPFRAEIEKRRGRPLGYPLLFERCTPSAVNAYRTVIGKLDTALSDLSIDRLSTLLETTDVVIPAGRKSAWIEISSVNDVPPVYSPLNHWKKPAVYPSYMSIEIFSRIFELFAQDAGFVENVHLAGLGEPLQHPQYAEVLRLLDVFTKKYPVMPGIHCYTDGRLMGGDIAEHMARGPVASIMVSLDAVDEPHYLKIRPAGDFQTVKRNIDRLLELKRARPRSNLTFMIGPVIILTTTLIAELEDHVDAFMSSHMTRKKWIKRYGRDFTFDNEIAAVRTFYDEGHMVEHLVIQGASTHAGQNPDHRLTNFTPLKRFPCRRMSNTLFVKTDGSIVLCDRMFNPASETSVGNVMEILSFLEAWNRMRPHREAHREGQYTEASPLCGRCDDWFIPVD
ncbi:MAG: hypothetical protein A3G34_14110 [Candidatus Lindowbacteria bacterium RIFCSPLOWO2_12_FULL_62_27]|nr:MAG: hypothetical protein A3I06_00505 [Candidatus Lindowbacteria bacterium RIFCSPLOWO2_02_FULL_62_12]OGH62700.1 MAG: hypothetical protein A3G34_14110 [Candidatus Lindowbacteria bacterium RIFCSPLOWO2_12_FULL_62_27]